MQMVRHDIPPYTVDALLIGKNPGRIALVGKTSVLRHKKEGTACSALSFKIQIISFLQALLRVDTPFSKNKYCFLMSRVPWSTTIVSFSP